MLNVYPIRFRFISARLLASTPPLCKRYFQYRHGRRWFHAAAMFLPLQKLAAQHGTRMYRVERVIYITCSNRNGVNADTLSRCVLCSDHTIDFRNKKAPATGKKGWSLSYTIGLRFPHSLNR